MSLHRAPFVGASLTDSKFHPPIIHPRLLPRATNNNNNSVGNGNSKNHTPANEMTVADLLPSLSSADDVEPLRKVAVPPRPPSISAQAQQMIDNFIVAASPSSALSVELRQARAEIAKRDAEIQSMKMQIAEQEGRLRAARSDLMEARAANAEMELKLREVFELLAQERVEAGSEKAKLREELVSTKMELEETQEELVSLADEILAMKELVLNDAELAELEQQQTMMMASNEGAATELNDGTWEVLQNLAQLSKQMLEEANLDTEAFFGAGMFSKNGNNKQK